MTAILRFLSSDTGRLARVAVGAALLTWGLMSLEAWPGRVAAVLALAPLVSGFTGRCLLPDPGPVAR